MVTVDVGGVGGGRPSLPLDMYGPMVNSPMARERKKTITSQGCEAHMCPYV